MFQVCKYFVQMCGTMGSREERKEVLIRNKRKYKELGYMKGIKLFHQTSFLAGHSPDNPSSHFRILTGRSGCLRMLPSNQRLGL